MRFKSAVPEANRRAQQYAGDKAALKPIYERLVAIAAGFGPDVTLQPRNTYVALARKKQFCVIKPSTKTRVDVGLKLPGKAVTGRLVEAANLGSGSMTHKVSLTKVEQIDEQLISWMQEAYAGVG